MARKIIEALDVPWVVLLSMDSFYKARLRKTLACGAGQEGQGRKGAELNGPPKIIEVLLRITSACWELADLII